MYAGVSGIAAAKAKDKTLPLPERIYKGAKPTAHAKAASVLALLAPGHSKKQIARDLNIDIASVYRIIKAAG